MEKYSLWFRTPVDPPVRVGVYEILSGDWTPEDAPMFFVGVIQYAYWTGTHWLVFDSTPKAALRWKDPETASRRQHRWWRGLTEEYAQSIAGRITNG